MKLIHLSDLHIGKRVNDFSMLEDQKYILKVILGIIDDEKPQGVIIAGDVYDKSVPSAEAVQLFDDFLVKLAQRGLHTFVISGNHDSAERIAFGNRLMDVSGIHMSPVYNGTISPHSLQDEFGAVNIYMLPFIKPANVRPFFDGEEILTYTDAVKCALSNINIDECQRNVIITHQFVTGATRSDSEEVSVGGSDNVEAYVFDNFDYVALGHIHRPQSCGRATIRYCGTPLKYSFSEASHEKSVTVIELLEKGNINLRTIDLVPKRDMREIKGTYDEVTSKEFYEGTNTEDYLHVTLTDEEDVPDALGKLRLVYPNIMKLDYDNTRTRSIGEVGTAQNVQRKTPFELFSEFYEKQNNQPMSDEQSTFVAEIIEKIWEAE